MTTDDPRAGDDLDPRLLERYWFGGASVAETTAVESWFARYPEQRAWYERLRRGLIAEMEARAVTPADVHRTVTTVLATTMSVDASMRPRRATPGITPDQKPEFLGRQSGKSGLPVRLFTDPGRWRTASYVALGVVVMLIAVFGGRLVVRHFAAEPGMAPMMTYATNRAERARITLPDGSHVTLDVASQLDVPTDFVRGDRTLHLSGEALFSVTHHGSRPFTVVAGGTKAQVLGTTFMVRKYPDDSVVTVAVQEGRVAVRSAVVVANQLLQVPPVGSLRIGVADSTQFAFATGLLTFDWVPLKDAIPDLDRWYDADIRVTDTALEQIRIKASFASGSRAELAGMLAMALNARVVQDGHVLTFSPK